MGRLVFYSKLLRASFIGWALDILLGRHIAAVVAQTSNGLFATDIHDMGVGKAVRKTGSYGDNELPGILSYIGKDDDVLVVGAHIGTLVVPMAKRCRSVVAIEANPDTFRLLQMNLLLNGLNNVRALNIAASDKTETIEFVSSRNNSGGAKRMPKVRAFEYFYDTPATISVPAFALDSYLKDQDFSLVLMDIEGSEYFALKGMQRILQNARTLFVEYLPHHLRNVSGVSPSEFLNPIAPHFNKLSVPSQSLQVQKSEFLPTLQAMFDHEQGDDGIVFAK